MENDKARFKDEFKQRTYKFALDVIRLMEQLTMEQASLTKAIKGEDTLLKVKFDIEMAQEVQANDAVNAVFFRDGITESFDVLHFGIGEAEGFESYPGNKMGPRGIAERDEFFHQFRGVTNVN
jgi:hypothetical protein